MPPISKNKSSQDMLYLHFEGNHIRAVDAVLIYLKKYDTKIAEAHKVTEDLKSEIVALKDRLKLLEGESA